MGLVYYTFDLESCCYLWYITDANCVDAVGGVKETFETSINLIDPKGQITKVGWVLKKNFFDIDKLIKKNAPFRSAFIFKNDLEFKSGLYNVASTVYLSTTSILRCSTKYCWSNRN